MKTASPVSSHRAPFDAASPPTSTRASGCSPLLRQLVRGFGLGLGIALAIGDFHLRRDRATLPGRARWLHRWSRFATRILGLECSHRGTPPTSGMIVSNHLGYLDILAYSAIAPCLFVAKRDVARWPVFGTLARMAGTIFVDRTRRMEVGETNARIADALRTGVVVVLFAEGTSSDGRAVLPFRPALLETPARGHCPVSPAAIHYQMDDGSVPDEVCYWGDMTLVPHLANLVRRRRIRARVVFGESARRTATRKETALSLHERVSLLGQSAQRSLL